MSERILRALMQLFAIIAKVEEDPEEGVKVSDEAKEIVRLFLKQQLNQEQVEEYLEVYDDFVKTHHVKTSKKDGSKKRTSLNSVKILRICTQINEELTQKQKLVVLVRLFEFIYANRAVDEQDHEFLETVGETFNISKEEYNSIKKFIESESGSSPESENLLLITNEKESKTSDSKHIYAEGLEGEIWILRIESIKMYVMRYTGKSELNLNGQLINNRSNYILTQGSSIRSSKVKPIYYSDIISTFMSDTSKTKVVFKAQNIEYRFPNGGIGLHPINIIEESGRMIGIMGGSGAGKSTLLNVLNGNYKPTEGSVVINGVDIHSGDKNAEGIIGYVSQDDLLIEELTVFQNLFYNAKLCFGNLNDTEIAKMVLEMLESLGLYETRDLKVGSPMDKTISGGQRKRLNIALELIREPAVLFVDEPTSGLSSRDSENIMDLLKELALKGKLIFVVIHQPSSDIFKMFDKLFILDQGGYPIYNGNPVDGVVYFKSIVNHVNSQESECPTCGNVNPEQIFNIIESKVVDEYGNQTKNRKISPKQWNKHYHEHIGSKIEDIEGVNEKPDSIFKIPNVLNQFKIFFTRDVLSKLTNQQYMLINLLEAPILAAILAFFLKYYNADARESAEYIFRENENLPQFLFIAVVVALFLGLTVAAEEIIRDQKILKRESFLNLSKGSYLSSKISIMFIMSAVQVLLFVLVGNLILEIKGMWFAYWMILFSTACFANVLGLNISASFNSAKVIYILIPILIIPQLLFSGVIVKFDKLYPAFASQSSVPAIGNIMASRWAYEALAVTQFKDNDFESKFFNADMGIRYSNWKKDYWVKEMRSKSNFVKRNFKNEDRNQSEFEAAFKVLYNEMVKENSLLKDLQFEEYESLTPEKADTKLIESLERHLDVLTEHYRNVHNRSNAAREDILRELNSDEKSRDIFRQIRDDYRNESLRDAVTNKNDLTFITEYNYELVQKSDPIYALPYHAGLFDAHFYAPKKKVFGKFVDTFWANIIVLWLMSFVLIVTLYFDVLKRIIDFLGNIGEYIPFKKGE